MSALIFLPILLISVMIFAMSIAEGWNKVSTIFGVIIVLASITLVTLTFQPATPISKIVKPISKIDNIQVITYSDYNKKTIFVNLNKEFGVVIPEDKLIEVTIYKRYYYLYIFSYENIANCLEDTYRIIDKEVVQ